MQDLCLWLDRNRYDQHCISLKENKICHYFCIICSIILITYLLLNITEHNIAQVKSAMIDSYSFVLREKINIVFPSLFTHKERFQSLCLLICPHSYWYAETSKEQRFSLTSNRSYTCWWRKIKRKNPSALLATKFLASIYIVIVSLMSPGECN
jgi:hypothetical protein